MALELAKERTNCLVDITNETNGPWVTVNNPFLTDDHCQDENGRVQALFNASAALAVKISNAPHQPETVRTGSATNNGPNRAARRIRLQEIMEPCTAVTYRNP